MIEAMTPGIFSSLFLKAYIKHYLDKQTKVRFGSSLIKKGPVWETLCMGLIVKLIWFNTSLNPTVYMVHCKPMFIRCTGLHFLIFYVIVFLRIWSSESFLIWCLFTEEREKPELLAESPARRKRIAQESGKTEQQVCMFATWYGFIFWSNCSFPGK